MRKSNIIICISIFFSLLSSCSKQDDDSEVLKINDLNKEFIVKSEGDLSKSLILAEVYSSFYPTQVFEKKCLVEDGVFSEIQTGIHPYSLIFDFYPIPYVEEVSEPKGVLSFTQVLANAMKSEEWGIYRESGVTKSQLLAYVLCSSKDDAKGFLKYPPLYKLLNENEGKYIFLAKIISSKFDVLAGMGDTILEDKHDNGCYISSVAFGRYAYLAIFTNENPGKIVNLFVNGILKGDAAYTNEYLKISSSINLIEKGGSSSGGYWGESGFRKLVEIFNTNSSYSGVPIYFELRDVDTKEVVDL